MYVNYYDRYEKLPDENSTIGILLCTEKNDTVVRMTLPENNQSILASEYKLYLPSSEQLIKEIDQVKKLAKKIAEKKSLAGKIRELTDDQIVAKINELKQELFNLRFQAEVGKLEKTADLRKVKKEIARCYTVLTERANANN